MVLNLVELPLKKALGLWYITLLKHHQIHLLIEASSYICLLDGMKCHHLLQIIKLLDKKPPVKDNSSIAQEQTLEALTKDTSSSSSVSVPICHGKQLIKLKPPPVAHSATSSQNKLLPVAQAATSAQNKHDDDLSTTSSSSIHSGTQALQLLIEDDDLYFNVKQPAITNISENKTQPTALHIFNCNMGSNTAEDVTTEIDQSIEHQLVQQQELMVQNVESVTMKKKELNVLNINHEDEFKERMESYNMQNGADSFDIIVNDNI